MAITADGADTYFAAGNHVHAVRWASFDPTTRAGALAMSRRIIARAIDEALNDAEAAYVEGDTYREEYAVYEQTLHVLLNATWPNAEGNGPQFEARVPEATAEAKQRDPHTLAPEALRWLGVSHPRIVLRR